jgi:hypothetical protein
MAANSYSCSVKQGFNFEKDSQVLVGHLTYLKIGDKEFAADLNVANPEDNTTTVKVVGVISNIHWNGGYAEPISINSQISNANKTAAGVLVHTNLANTEVLYKFNVYDFDPKEKKYYKAFHTNDEQLKGLILKSGGDLALQIATDEGYEVPSPKNFALYIGVMPQDLDQAVQVAVSVNDKFAKKWGVEVAA